MAVRKQLSKNRGESESKSKEQVRHEKKMSFIAFRLRIP